MWRGSRWLGDACDCMTQKVRGVKAAIATVLVLLVAAAPAVDAACLTYGSATRCTTDTSLTASLTSGWATSRWPRSSVARTPLTGSHSINGSTAIMGLAL